MMGIIYCESSVAICKTVYRPGEKYNFKFYKQSYDNATSMLSPVPE